MRISRFTSALAATVAASLLLTGVAPVHAETTTPPADQATNSNSSQDGSSKNQGKDLSNDSQKGEKTDDKGDGTEQKVDEISSKVGSSDKETNSSTLKGGAKSFGIGLGKTLGAIVLIGFLGWVLNRLGLPH